LHLIHSRISFISGPELACCTVRHTTVQVRRTQCDWLERVHYLGVYDQVTGIRRHVDKQALRDRGMGKANGD